MAGNRVLMKGNEAVAEAAIRAGCRHFFGYPITPQTEVSAYMAKKMPQIGGVFLQAESELAAINMVLGASAAGVRAMTSSSSPGISLKSEGLSYIAASDLPCLVLNIQRAGPGLGGIQPSQSDYFQATKAPGHGDLRLMVFAPSTVQEMVDLVFKAFDYSDKYRVPSMILGDGLLGQMMEPVSFPETEVKPYEKPWAVTGTQNSRKPNIVNSLYLQPNELEDKIVERFKRYELIKKEVTESESYRTEDADILLVAYGAAYRIARSAVEQARENGVKAGIIRPVTLWPYPSEAIAQAAQNAKQVLVVEMSMGQMVEDVRLAVNGARPVQFFGHTGGIVPTPKEVLQVIEEMNRGER